GWRVRQRSARLVADRHRGCGSVPAPDQHGTVLIHSELLGLDDLSFKVFEIVLVEVEAALQRPIRHPPVAPQQVKHLGQELVKRHACLLPLGEGFITGRGAITRRWGPFGATVWAQGAQRPSPPALSRREGPYGAGAAGHGPVVCWSGLAS